MRLVRIVLLGLFLLLPALAFGQLLPYAPPESKPVPIFKLAAGVNAVAYDGVVVPSDFEAGLNARASLSPHISLVGSGYYGITEQYWRGAGGVRVTASDANNPDFSIGIGAQYHVSDAPEARPKEWAADVSMGWRPWAARRFVLIALGQYGMTSNQASAHAGGRLELLSF